MTIEEDIKNFIKELERLNITNRYGHTIQTRDTITTYIKYREFHKILKKYKLIFGVD